jgi:hypothetical protein
MKHIRTRPLTTLAVLALLAAIAPPTRAHPRAQVFRGELVDISPTVDDPFSDARAKFKIKSRHGHTQFVLKIRGIDVAAAEPGYGAHLHIGPCVEGQPTLALGHYNVSTVIPPTVNAETEVWLDFTVRDSGRARSAAWVDWVPEPGDRSVVIHADETAADGTAGARLVCLPVQW